MRKILVLLLLVMFCGFSFGHGGRLDSQGGHFDKKQGTYHCHQEPCFSSQLKTDNATQEAIKEHRPVTLIYRRDDWKHWSDVDGDCMNTRHEMLKEQADGPVKLSPDGCYVSVGLWNDPYSGKTFTRASDLDVDHLVPLKWANDHGGARWSPEIKEAFANDPVNLLVVDDGLNQEKSAKGPSEWMPPNHLFRCQYLAMWGLVLNKYRDLKMTASELRIFERQKSACQ